MLVIQPVFPALPRAKGILAMDMDSPVEGTLFHYATPTFPTPTINDPSRTSDPSSTTPTHSYDDYLYNNWREWPSAGLSIKNANDILFVSTLTDFDDYPKAQMIRTSDNGNTWTKMPFIGLQDEYVRNGNECPEILYNGTEYLYAGKFRTNGGFTYTTHYWTSPDLGTWTPITITHGGSATWPDNGNSLRMPYIHEANVTNGYYYISPGLWYDTGAILSYSTNGGDWFNVMLTWAISGSQALSGAYNCGMVQNAGGDIFVGVMKSGTIHLFKIDPNTPTQATEIYASAGGPYGTYFHGMWIKDTGEITIGSIIKTSPWGPVSLSATNNTNTVFTENACFFNYKDIDGNSWQDDEYWPIEDDSSYWGAYITENNTFYFRDAQGTLWWSQDSANWWSIFNGYNGHGYGYPTTI